MFHRNLLCYLFSKHREILLKKAEKNLLGHLASFNCAYVQNSVHTNLKTGGHITFLFYNFASCTTSLTRGKYQLGYASSRKMFSAQMKSSKCLFSHLTNEQNFISLWCYQLLRSCRQVSWEGIFYSYFNQSREVRSPSICAALIYRCASAQIG